jgi:elongation factor Ts
MLHVLSLSSRGFGAAKSRSFSSMAVIKALRERTGAPILECKNALQQDDVNGDVEKAVDWLRKNGVAAASKRADKDAAEGLVGVAVSDCGKIGALVQLNSETDFVARNELFQTLLRTLTERTLDLGSDHLSQYKDLTAELLEDCGDDIADLGGKVRENIKLARAEVVNASTAEEGFVASYVHNALGPGMGTVGCLVGIEGVDGGKQASLLLGQQVALHVAAAAPLYLNVASVPVEATERESAILREQALASGKPENIVDKMIQGRIKKFYSEHCLLEQEFVVDDSKRSVKKVVSSEGGETASLIGFAWRKTGGTASGEKSGF